MLFERKRFKFSRQSWSQIFVSNFFVNFHGLVLRCLRKVRLVPYVLGHLKNSFPILLLFSLKLKFDYLIFEHLIGLPILLDYMLEIWLQNLE